MPGATVPAAWSATKTSALLADLLPTIQDLRAQFEALGPRRGSLLGESGRMDREIAVLHTVYPTVPAQVDYRLTETGASLTHLVRALADWSLIHRAVIAEARHEYDRTHADHDIR